MRLDEATDFEGTCEEMCPEWEREEREYQNNVDPLERVRLALPAARASPAHIVNRAVSRHDAHRPRPRR